MSLAVFNTLTREKETFETLEPGKVRMYVCGPTVYSDAHVGHAMSSIVFDFVRRYLEYKRVRGPPRHELHRCGRQDHRAGGQAG